MGTLTPGNPQPLTEKHQQARDGLPDELKPVFDEFVEEYKFYASLHYGSRLVSYIILADLVRAGWRPSAAPMPQPGESAPSTSDTPDRSE